MHKSLLFLFIFITLTFQTGFSQQFRSFSEDPAVYIEELAKYMRVNISDENEKVLSRFISYWSSDSLFNPTEQKNIIEISNLLLKNKARSNPHYRNYIYCLINFKEKQHDSKSFLEWEKSLIHLLTLQRVSVVTVNSFLETTINLLKENILNKSSSVEWKSENNRFRFHFDEYIKVVFENTELTCYAKRDSIIISNTRGVYYPIDKEWAGNGGMVAWERSGFKINDVSAMLSQYKIDMTRSEYSADNVTFTNIHYFDEPLTGRLSDQVRLIRKPEDAIFPAFYSYKQNFFIKNLYENINYTGGFSMQGIRLIGTGSRTEDAYLHLFRNDTLFIKINSKYFVFRPDRVIGRQAGLTILLGKDSIYHSDLNVTYLVDNMEINAIQSENYTAQSPYFNSYHNIDMNFEQLNWKVGDSRIYFTMMRGRSIGQASFRSINFFDYAEFSKMQGMDWVHPLNTLKNFVDRIKREEFTVEEYADYRKLALHQVRLHLLNLAVLGFIYYNTEDEMVNVRPKLYDYLSASIGRIDYDVINLVSRTEAPTPNAYLDLRNFDLTIHGTPAIALSNAQNVLLRPKNNTIIMKRDRSFQFDGTIDAGLFTFYGSNFFFNYSDFMINLQNVDSLNIKVIGDEKDNFGRDILYEVMNLIQNLTGELLIDDPENKSGVQEFEQYPIFKSREDAYVYYEANNIQQGVYKKNDFYFQVYPFEFEQLNSFNKDSLKFEGEFVSAGIFPVLEQTLELQPDYSLGFTFNTITDGIPVYGDKGILYNTVNMSNHGLKANGELDYLTSKARSREFNFYPDSVTGIVETFTIQRQTTGIEYPDVQSNNQFIRWLPKSDEFYAIRQDNDFKMYNQQASLYGDLVLAPTGLSGTGMMDINTADFRSKKFNYKANSFASDTTDFRLKSINTEGYTVVTGNVKTNINFQQRRGDFSSNSELNSVLFPENRYVGYVDQFTWKMDQNELEMRSDRPYLADIVPVIYKSSIDEEDMQLVGARYTSTHFGQDSLSFVAPLAIYDYRLNHINAKEVEYVRVADAKIYPDEKELTIEQRANVRPLENALIVTNYETRYHAIHSAYVKINGALNFTGSGDYNYTDENGDIQIIHFSDIKVDDSFQTIATGEITEPEDFTLSPDFEYQGSVQLFANKEHLNFRGATRLVHNCEQIGMGWMMFEASIDPDHINIPVASQPRNINLQNIYAGLFITSDSIHIYPAFLSGRKNYNDLYVSTAHGNMVFNKETESYIIASEEKILNPELPGNYLALDRNACNLEGGGKINLGVELGQVELTTVGTVKHEIQQNKTTFDVLLGFDFMLNDDAVKYVIHDFDSLPGMYLMDISLPKYRRGLLETAGVEKTEQFFNELSLYGTYRNFPKEINKTLLLSDVKLEWNNMDRAYQSTGNIGVGNIYDEMINKYFEGYLEITKRRSGDFFDIYFQLNRNNWYYFAYTRGVMQTLSTNAGFIANIRDLKPNQRKMKVSSRETSYIYMLSTDQKFGSFLRKVRDRQAGIESMEMQMDF